MMVILNHAHFIKIIKNILKIKNINETLKFLNIYDKKNIFFTVILIFVMGLKILFNDLMIKKARILK